MLDDTDILTQLFQKQKIATMPELKRALGTDVDVTVFRKLKPLGYRTSYSHRGCYYTLDAVAQFDERGLWTCRSVYFSSQGTLIRTAQALVESSEAGFLASELDKLLHVANKDVLRKLVQQGRLARQRISGHYVYCACDPQKRTQQLLARRVSDQSPLAPPQSTTPSDELKAAVVLFLSLLDERQRRCYAGLESLRWGYGGDRRVADLLGMDVATIARGRRDLQEGNVEVERVRRAGGGRKPIKKKHRR